MKKIDVWRWVERLVLLGSIAGLWINNKIDKATWRTKVEIQLETLIKSDEKKTNYWDNQNEINGGILEYMRTRSDSPGTDQEAEEN